MAVRSPARRCSLVSASVQAPPTSDSDVAPAAPATPPDRRTRFFELVRFGLVGGFSTVLYFAVYSGLSLAGAPLGVASLGGFAVSISFGFVLHHRFTFKTGATNDRVGFVRWVILQASVLLLNLGALSLLVHQAGLDRIVAQLILLPLIPLLTFFLSRRLVFKPAS
jgi:putative flippase GtrA